MRLTPCFLLATISCAVACTNDDVSPQTPDAGTVAIAAPATPTPTTCPPGQLSTRTPAGWTCTDPLQQASLQGIQNTVDALNTALRNQQAELQSAAKETEKKK